MLPVTLGKVADSNLHSPLANSSRKKDRRSEILSLYLTIVVEYLNSC